MAGTHSDRSCTLEHRRSRTLSHSPPRWVGRRGKSERQVLKGVVEWVVEHAAPVGNFPVLTKMNYYDWAALMRMMLHAWGLWDVVSVGTSDYTEDCMALEVIAKVVPLEMLGSIASNSMAKAAWEAIVLRNVGVDRVCKAKAGMLKREFNSLAFNDGESVDEFNARIEQITNQLAVLRFEYKDEEVV
jgi:hypothetical protein